MHVRINTRRRGTTVYRYVQLVQSYRRPDGMPAHRVIASLGDLSELETANLKASVAASREGQPVVVRSLSERVIAKVKANLDYYGIAVLHSLWGECRLTSLIDELAPETQSEVSVGDVVGALVFQRNTEPASKLAATSWYPTTALPELQAIAPSQFNNTRIHRVLEVLDTIREPLQERLARRIAHREGQFVHLFLDCTDTWFTGRGPDMAHMRSTKEGLTRRLVGIALLCDQRGMPLRWATLPGDYDERGTMLDVVAGLANVSWTRGVPLVVDRALGRGVYVADLLSSGLNFVTAVPAPELPAWCPAKFIGAFNDITISEDDDDTRAALRQRALELGLEEASSTRYVRDLGVVSQSEGTGPTRLRPSRAEATLRIARQVQADLDAACHTLDDLAVSYRTSVKTLQRYLSLLQLDAPLQARVLDGAADGLASDVLQGIASLPVPEQADAFEAACKEVPEGHVRKATRAMADLLGAADFEARCVLVFSPDLFMEHVGNANKVQEQLGRFVDQVNEKLSSKRSRSSASDVEIRVGAEIRRLNLTDVASVKVGTITVKDGRKHLQARLVRDEEAWHRRRRTDGLVLIVASAAVSEPAGKLVEIFYAKDKVEKDFQTIKSVIQLRPVRHFTDGKVRAHVDICMLALLMERILETRLADGGAPCTAARALHALSTAKLNLYEGEAPLYSTTTPDREQMRLLTALGMTALADDEAVAEILKPR